MIDSIIQPAFIQLSLLTLLTVSHEQRIKWLGSEGAYLSWLALPISLFLTLTPSKVIGQFVPQVYEVMPNVTISSMLTTNAWPSLISYLWLVGAIVFWLREWGRNASRKRVFIKPPASPFVSFLTQHGVKAAGTRDITGPFVTNLFSPCVIVPSDINNRFNTVQQEMMAEHELIHLQRADLLCRTLFVIYIGLLWFYPIKRLAFMRFCQEQELSCDAKVVSKRRLIDRKLYADAMLTASTGKVSHTMAFTNGEGKMLKQRFANIKNTPRTTTRRWVPALIVLLTGAFLGHVATAEQSGITDGLAPLQRVEPFYPVQAADKGLEGYVTLTFDVLADGSVENISVVDAEPKSVFERESTKALSQWRYPTGNPAKGMLVQLAFTLDD